MATALVFGALFLAEGSLELGALFASISVIAILSSPLRDLGRVYEFWKNALVAREKIGVFLERAGDTPKVSRTTRVGARSGELRVNRLQTPSISEPIDTAVAGGDRVVITGANGSGKSELLNVLSGLSPVLAGTVEIDGVPTRDLNDSERSRAIGMAGEDVSLVNGSVSKNVRYRHPDASREAVRNATRDAGLTDIGIDDQRRIGPRGAGLSEGEIARIKIARAILEEPPILLLDEIERGLDRRGRVALAEILATYPGTILYVTHDTELIGFANVCWHIEENRMQIDPIETTTRREATA